MMRALIVDDEVYAREELAALLDETGEFVIVGKAANAPEAIEKINQVRPDVVFLDIQMPVINGFELLSMIDEKVMPRIVFVTAYDEYALKAFEANALDYLLKPVERGRLVKTVTKLKQMPSREMRPGLAWVGPDIRKVPCLTSSGIKLVNVEDIEYVRSTEAGVYVVCLKGEFYTELTLKVLEGRTGLLRCHKQYLVNIDQIDVIVPLENMVAEIKTKSGRTIPISRRHFKALKEQLIF